MEEKRKAVEILLKEKSILVEELFHKKVPQGIIVRENPRTITHYHSYGGISGFFKGLTEGKLLGTRCKHCPVDPYADIWLPPRADCPDCWQQMEWIKVYTAFATVYTHSTTHYPGAGFKASVPCPLISVKIPGVWTYFMSYMSSFGDGEPYIGMPIKPTFRTENPTYTILDISWVPDDERIKEKARDKDATCNPILRLRACPPRIRKE